MLIWFSQKLTNPLIKKHAEDEGSIDKEIGSWAADIDV